MLVVWGYQDIELDADSPTPTPGCRRGEDPATTGRRNGASSTKAMRRSISPFEPIAAPAFELIARGMDPAAPARLFLQLFGELKRHRERRGEDPTVGRAARQKRWPRRGDPLRERTVR